MTAPQIRLGVHVTLTDRSVSLDAIGSALQDRGLDALYVSEHTHIPVHYNRVSYPEPGGMPERYKRTLDPYIALSFVAARYSIEIGTCVALVANHDPIALAKAVATLDYLSGGRFFMGVGFGWCAEEFSSHKPQPPSRRPEVARETVEIMRRLWTDDEAQYEGRFLQLAPSWSWPKPSPHPPVLLGGHPTAANFERVAQWADGWITMGTFPNDDDFAPTMERLRGQWAAAGRPLSDLQVLALVGSLRLADIERALEVCVEQGVQRLAVHIGEVDGADLYRLLDGLGRLRTAYVG